MATHELKTLAHFFRAVMLDRKTMEIRKNDRGFEVGDILILREYYPQTNRYTGRTVERIVSHVVSHLEFPEGIQPGYVVLSFFRP